MVYEVEQEGFVNASQDGRFAEIAQEVLVKILGYKWKRKEGYFYGVVSDFTQIIDLYGNIILTSGFREVEVWQIESCIDKTIAEPLVSYRMVLSDPFENNGQKDQLHIAHFVNYAGYDSDVLDNALEEFFSDERFQVFDVDVF